MRSLIDDSVVTCDKIADTQETVTTDSVNKKATCKMDYCVLYTFLLVTILVFIILLNCHYIKHQLTKRHITVLII